MKNVLQLLFADPDLVTRDLVNGVLAYKRLDGVDEALRTGPTGCSPDAGRRRCWTSPGQTFPYSPSGAARTTSSPPPTPITCPTTLASISSTARATRCRWRRRVWCTAWLPTSSEVWSPEQRPVPGSVTVGVVANPASGRDIRRLVAGASVFDNVEKGNMVYRFMVGLGAVSVERVLMMPAASGLYDGLQRALHGHAFEIHPLPKLELVEMRLRHDARDTVEAVEKMREQGVKAIAVLGGDGTNRVVASRCSDTPICALSTGTNNAFPEMREATIAGLATGLVATDLVSNGVLRQEKILRVGLNGDLHHDCALVDVAVSSEPLSEPERCGRAVRSRSYSWPRCAGRRRLLRRGGAAGSHPSPRVSRPVPPAYRAEDARLVLNAPLAPGLVGPVGVAEIRLIEPGVRCWEAGSRSIALDGERQIERSPRPRGGELGVRRPLTIDVGEAMRLAAGRGLLSDRSLLKKASASGGFAPAKTKCSPNRRPVTGL